MSSVRGNGIANNSRWKISSIGRYRFGVSGWKGFGRVRGVAVPPAVTYITIVTFMMLKESINSIYFTLLQTFSTFYRWCQSRGRYQNACVDYGVKEQDVRSVALARFDMASDRMLLFTHSQSYSRRLWCCLSSTYAYTRLQMHILVPRG